MGSAPKGAPRLTPKATLRPRSKGSLDSRGNIENGRRLARPCLQCHGAHGVSGLSFRPTLAGQKAVYLREQLESFRRAYSEAALGYAPRSLRSELLMNRNAAGLGDDEIYDLSLYLSRLPCGGGVTPAARARPVAPKIARRCAGCHGKEGVSTDQNVPNLAGQKRMYLIQQLVEFQKSAHRPAPQLHQQRRFSAIMAPEVVALSAQDIDALATYYASLRCR
ncbi:c-type cytochrome [Varunaivibrio sulfuroxidans]|nr:c-type cytochrome [Varunaivibrio sulfuroxidans]WES32193.1 c-type cytochrome [Varunaivibrio sulfuroxidans]